MPLFKTLCVFVAILSAPLSFAELDPDDLNIIQVTFNESSKDKPSLKTLDWDVDRGVFLQKYSTFSSDILMSYVRIRWWDEEVNHTRAVWGLNRDHEADKLKTDKKGGGKNKATEHIKIAFDFMKPVLKETFYNFPFKATIASGSDLLDEMRRNSVTFDPIKDQAAYDHSKLVDDDYNPNFKEGDETGYKNKNDHLYLVGKSAFIVDVPARRLTKKTMGTKSAFQKFAAKTEVKSVVASGKYHSTFHVLRELPYVGASQAGLVTSYFLSADDMAKEPRTSPYKKLFNRVVGRDSILSDNDLEKPFLVTVQYAHNPKMDWSFYVPGFIRRDIPNAIINSVNVGIFRKYPGDKEKTLVVNYSVLIMHDNPVSRSEANEEFFGAIKYLMAGLSEL